MRKLVKKNQKGFTLIELMMVVAVIGILAAVLIPKMGGIKTNAKLSGVESNTRQVEATVHALIERYKNNPTDLDEAIINALNGEDATVNKEDITNPFTDNFGASASGTSHAVIVNSVTGNASSPVVPLTGGVGYEGVIHVQVFYKDDKVVKVVIVPYDNKGTAMPSKTITP